MNIHLCSIHLVHSVHFLHHLDVAPHAPIGQNLPLQKHNIKLPLEEILFPPQDLFSTRFILSSQLQT